jgi:outer membrane protein insertion porin family
MNSLRNFARTLGLAVILAFAAPVIGGFGSIGSVFGAGGAEAAVVTSITVQGNQRIEAATIRNYITIKPGVSFGPADIDDSVKDLYSTGLFSDVGVSQRGNTLVVVVSENQIVNTVIFQGNKKIKSNILVTLVDTKSRGVLTEPQLQADVQRLKDYYDHSGRSNATIETQVTQLDNNRVDVVFVINEAGRTGVKTISFVGNQAFSDGRLRRVIQTRQSNWLSWLNRKDVYDPAKLDADEELLRRFYMTNGYADFQVLSVDTSFDEDAGKYHVVFTVEEGTKYRFGEISIDSSIPGIDPSTLYKYVKFKRGKVFNATLVERTIENITIELSRRGHPFAQVRPRGDRDYENATISVTLLIDEGPRIYVERIDIFGNTKTRDYVIRREFDLAEGDAYNRVLVDRAERRLRALGFFKTVSITTEPGTEPDRVIIVVTVVEDQTGSFSIGGGYSTSDGFIAEIALTEKNFLGRGQKLRVSYGMGENSNTFNVSFTDPYFLGYKMSAGFDAFGSSSDSTDNKPYDRKAIGGTLRVGLPITDSLDLNLNYKIVDEDISNVVSTNAELFYPPGNSITSSVGYGFVYSTLDNELDPHDGMYAKFTQDVAGVGGAARFVRTSADARYYQQIFYGSDIIGMLRMQGGNIVGLGKDVRTQDDFFKGGETIRGFAPYGIGARLSDPGDDDDGMPLGGKNYVAATAEIQFPLPVLPSDFGLRGAVFADAGTLFDVDAPTGYTGTIQDDASIRSSVGASVLWQSPFGLLRGDFAYALTKESYDKTQIFRFSAGTQF